MKTRHRISGGPPPQEENAAVGNEAQPSTSRTTPHHELQRDALRAAFGRWASGVCVVTARDTDGAPVGVTATSFSVVSKDPPLISWCIDNRAYSLPAFAGAAEFAVHVLGEHQDETSSCFAEAGGDKFAFRPIDEDADSPLLRHCLARFICERHQVITAGDHTILLGHVRHLSYTDGKPLLYFRGKYGVYGLHPRHDHSLIDGWL